MIGPALGLFSNKDTCDVFSSFLLISTSTIFPSRLIFRSGFGEGETTIFLFGDLLFDSFLASILLINGAFPPGDNIPFLGVGMFGEGLVKLFLWYSGEGIC